MNPAGLIFGIASKVFERFFPDPEERAKAMFRLKELEQNGDLAVIAGQVEINKIEAGNPRLWVSGWRPWIGWVCGSALALQLLIFPIVEWGCALANKSFMPPAIRTELLTTTLIGMLGLGGMRTVEKLQDKASN